MAAIFVRAVQDKRRPLRRPAHFVALLRHAGAARVGLELAVGVAAVVPITVPLAFVFAYALTRSCMPFKGTFRLIALIPLLAPSLLSAISFIQWFGNQGALKWLLSAAHRSTARRESSWLEVYNTFPHALMILLTALLLADGRLYEAADSLRTPRLAQVLHHHAARRASTA